MDDRKLMSVWRARQRGVNARPIGQVLQDVQIQRLLEQCRLDPQLRRGWEQVVPKEFAGKTEVDAVRRGVLYVRVPDASQRYLLETVHKPALLEAIRSEVRQARIKAIRFVAGRPSRPDDEERTGKPW